MQSNVVYFNIRYVIKALPCPFYYVIRDFQRQHFSNFDAVYLERIRVLLCIMNEKNVCIDD